MDFARRYYISTLHGTGVGKLYRAIDEAYAAVQTHISTPQITPALEKALKTHQPLLVSGRRIKLRYAHMGGNDPLVIVIHGKQVTEILSALFSELLSPALFYCRYSHSLETG